MVKGGSERRRSEVAGGGYFRAQTVEAVDQHPTPQPEGAVVVEPCPVGRELHGEPFDDRDAQGRETIQIGGLRARARALEAAAIELPG